jgi:hypothetical protein
MQMNRTEAAVKRTSPTGYHGYCPVFKAAILYFFRVKILFHIHQMVSRIREFV